MRIEKIWRCLRCNDTHSNEDAARACCPVSVVCYYECPECGEEYPHEWLARDCCPSDEPPSAAELDQAGQARLIP